MASTTMKRLLIIVFLRIYACNLGRKWRNSPEVACSDAILVMCILCIAPMAPIVFFSAALTGAVHLRQFMHSNLMLYGVAFAILLPLFYWLTKTFSRFAETPELAKPYMAPRTRLLSFIGMTLTPIACIAAGMVLAYVVR
jgi:hypothetical protein